MASLLATPAAAGGLYFTDRGVRPLGRAGAFIAGADDGGAIAYNPAGLAFAGNALLFDASWLQYKSSYQRKARLYQVDPNTGEPTGQTWDQTFEQVEGTTPVLPIPTLVYSNSFGVEHANFAIGLWAPYAAITSFPEKVRGAPAPQRYSLITLDGSALAIPGVYGSYMPSKQIALGAGIEALTGYFQTSVYFSACVPDRFICAPEQPEYDAYGQLRVGPIFAPTGILGAIFLPSDELRIGASFHLPIWVSSTGTQNVRLPSAAAFDQAHVEGDEVHVDFRLPWVARVGVEYRGIDRLRVELGAGYEAWSMHDKITVSSENLALIDVAGFPKVYKIPPLDIDRGFQDSWSVRTGAEYTFPAGSYQLGLRAGVMYEKSAIPNQYLSATTIDLDKVTFALGGSLYLGKWRFDGVVARVQGATAKVTLDEQRVKQLNPVLANPAERPHYVNAGTYTAGATVLGLGLVYQFDSPDGASAKPGAGRGAGGAPEPKPVPKSEPTPEKQPEPAAEDAGDEDFEKAFEKQTEKKPAKKGKR